jgi:hypothetical protein
LAVASQMRSFVESVLYDKDLCEKRKDGSAVFETA